MIDGKKVLFKKPKKRKLTQKRTHSSDDEEDKKIIIPNATDEVLKSVTRQSDESEEEDSALGKIQALKKARKIKSLLKISTLEKSQKKTQIGVGDNEKEDKVTNQPNLDLRQKLEGSFEVRTGNAVENENNVMTLKHQMAMQEYIDAQMKKGEVQNDSTHADQVNQEDIDMMVKDKKDLYAKLLREATLMHSGMNEESQVDEDVGAGGEMLGGTGIAEVELPVEQRLQIAKETALAASQLGTKAAVSGHTSNARDPDQITEQELAKMLPTSFVSGKKKSHLSKTDAIVSKESSTFSTHTKPKVHVPLNKDIAFPESQVNLDGIGSSYAHNFSLHNKEWIQKKKEENYQESNKDDAGGGRQDEIGDSSRIGFDAKRGKGTSANGHGDNQRSAQRSRDHTTYKNFVSRELKHIKR
jgi:hypothetical protein